MAEVRYDKHHHAGPDAEARIKSRMKPSCGKVDATTMPTRAHDAVYPSGFQHQRQPQEMPKGRDTLGEYGPDYRGKGSKR
jgi:hypothetical protein